MPIGLVLPDTFLVLDTNILTHWRKRHPYVRREVNEYVHRLGVAPALTSMTVFEALQGIESEVAKNKISAKDGQEYRGGVETMRRELTVLPFDSQASVIAAHIFARLTRAEKNAHWEDVLIAATALAHNHGLVTQNRKDFELIAKHLPESHPVLRLAVWKP